MNPNADKILMAAIELVRQEPDRLDMSIFGCGTVGCLAYHVCRATGASDKIWTSRYHSACAALGLCDCGDGKELFMVNRPESEWVSYRNEVMRGRKVEWLESHVRRFLERHGGQTLEGK